MRGDLSLIVFAYHYPPENAIGGQRPFRFCKYLTRLGWRCHVITAAPQTEGSPARYIPDPWVSPRKRGPAWQVERAVRRLVLPQVTGTRWSRRASEAARAIVQSEPSSRFIVLSTFPPLGTHLAGWQLARSERLPWVADFRDPLANNPGDEATLKPFQKHICRRLENQIAQRANLVLLNTDASLETWRERHVHRSERAHLIWNGFDPEDRSEPLPLRSRAKILSHVGELYRGRNVTPLLASFGRLINAGRVRPEELSMELSGPMEQESIPSSEFIAKAQEQGWLKVCPDMVPRNEARRLVQTSHGLLILQPHSTVQVPGKLFEYVQIGRPILAFVPQNSPIERILRRSGVPYKCVFSDASADEMDEAVLDYLQLHERCAANSWFENTFNARNQAQTLDRLLRSMCEPRGVGSDQNECRKQFTMQSA